MIIILCVKYISDIDCKVTTAIDQLSFSFCFFFFFILFIVYHLWSNKDVYINAIPNAPSVQQPEQVNDNVGLNSIRVPCLNGLKLLVNCAKPWTGDSETAICEPTKQDLVSISAECRRRRNLSDGDATSRQSSERNVGVERLQLEVDASSYQLPMELFQYRSDAISSPWTRYGHLRSGPTVGAKTVWQNSRTSSVLEVFVTTACGEGMVR